MAMVVQANRVDPSLGGHISSFASAATLYDVGFIRDVAQAQVGRNVLIGLGQVEVGAEPLHSGAHVEGGARPAFFVGGLPGAARGVRSPRRGSAVCGEFKATRETGFRLQVGR